jgi:diguanylate cyclase (GGDEF)-like protein/PAS domain S-box-containing protein
MTLPDRPEAGSPPPAARLHEPSPLDALPDASAGVAGPRSRSRRAAVRDAPAPAPAPAPEDACPHAGAPAPEDAPSRHKPVVIAFLVLSALMFAALAAYAALRSRVQYEERAERLTQNLAEATTRNISANVENIDLMLGVIVGHLEGQLAAGPLDRRVAREFVMQQVAQHPELDGLRVTDAAGVVIVSPHAVGGPPVDFSDRDWFVAQRDHAGAGLLMSQPLTSKITGNSIISFSRRYRTPDGRFAGAVTAAVPIAHFSKMIAGLDIGPHGAVIVRDAQLGLITREPPYSPGQGRPVGDRHVAPELVQAVGSGLPRVTVHVRRTADGIPRTSTMQRVGTAPLIVTVGVSPLDYLADWRREAASLAGLCLVAILLQVFGARRLLRLGQQNRLAQRRIELLAQVFDHASEALVVTDRHHRIIEVNPAFTRQTGYAASEATGQSPAILDARRDRQLTRREIGGPLRETNHWSGEFACLHKAGHVFPTWMSIVTLRDADGDVTHHVGSLVDLSEVKRAEERVVHLAHHDPLTDLPNREQLQGRLEQAMASARRNEEKLAMLFLDMDHFKNINDTLGHHIGDQLLVEVARRLKTVVRDSDIVSRLGGDEFVIVLTGVGREAVRGASHVADKILVALARPYAVAGHELHSTPSIGVGVFPDDGEDVDTLMRNTDAAMYQAKAAGRNNFKFFTPAMHRAAEDRRVLEAGLRRAIAHEELFVQYQPQVDARTGAVVAVEALLRWQHPTRGLVPPLTFIPIAEDSGQIDELGAWVLDQGLAQVARWRAAGHAALRVAVNLSARQLHPETLPGLVEQSLRRHGLQGDALELEITESVAMRDPARTRHVLQQLRALGVRLAIDDFGTGYSSLAYLKELPLDCLKLDRSFVKDIERDANDAAISAATIRLAHALGLAVVAEGVETTAQLDHLRGLDCDLLQGYHFSRPLLPADCGAYLDRCRAETAPAA